VRVAVGFERQISQPSIGVNDAASLNAVLDEGQQAGGRCVGKMPQTDATEPLAVFFDGHDDQSFGFGLATAYANFDTAQMALVNLDRAEKPLPSRPNHGPP